MYLDDCVCVLPDLTWLPLLGVGRKSWYIIKWQPVVNIRKESSGPSDIWEHNYSEPMLTVVKLTKFYHLLLSLKSELQTQLRKKLFTNCIRNPTSICATESWTKHNLGSNQRLIAPINPFKYPVSNIASVGKVMNEWLNK